jgi:hypothetical protein
MKASGVKRKSTLPGLVGAIETILLYVGTVRGEVTAATLVHFDGTNGYLPGSSLVRDGNFYGALALSLYPFSTLPAILGCIFKGKL